MSPLLTPLQIKMLRAGLRGAVDVKSVSGQDFRRAMHLCDRGLMRRTPDSLVRFETTQRGGEMLGAFEDAD